MLYHLFLSLLRDQVLVFIAIGCFLLSLSLSSQSSWNMFLLFLLYILTISVVASLPCCV